MEHYFRLMDFCQQEGLNTLIFRLTDDQGSACRFTSHPELNLCDGAFSMQELKQLVEYAGKKGIEVIPEIESFGHSRYITRTEQHAHLSDGPPGAEFNALCPVSDAAPELLKDLYAEVASVFPSRYIHIGCDEVNWGAGAASRRALETRSKDTIWAEYVNKLNARVKSLGRTAIIWGDVPIDRSRSLLDLLDKDIVLADWNYWETDKAKVGERAKTVLGKGFKLIGCPALSWCGWGPRVGELQFKNINAYAEAYQELRGPNNLGVIISNWVPKRYLQNSQWDTYTIAADILRQGGRQHPIDAIPAFVTNHFGAKFDPGWDLIFRTLYELAPQATCGKDARLKFAPWATDKEITDLLKKNIPVPDPFADVEELTSSYKGRVKRNEGDFDDLLLTIHFMSYCHKRQDALLDFANSRPTDARAVAAHFEKVSIEDHRMLEALEVAWRRGRRGKVPGMDKDFMWSFQIAAACSKRLADRPSDFISLLTKLAQR